MILRTGPDGYENSRPHQDWIPDRPACNESLYGLSYPGSQAACTLSKNYNSKRPQFPSFRNCRITILVLLVPVNLISASLNI